jgi:hypothetical protein
MTNVSTTMFPWRQYHIYSSLCSVFKPLLTSVYDLLHVVSSVSVTATVSGVGQARIYTNVETAMHVFWLSSSWNVDSENSPCYISLSTFSSFHYELIVWHFYLYCVMVRKFCAFIVHRFQHYFCAEINCTFECFDNLHL